jgi:hypothetical protein
MRSIRQRIELQPLRFLLRFKERATGKGYYRIQEIGDCGRTVTL